MSTYLLAFAIGQFESAQTATKSGTIVRALTPLGKIDQAKFGLDVGRRCLEFYEDYFDLPYPLPKLVSQSKSNGSEPCTRGAAASCRETQPVVGIGAVQV
jgi:aminopeptidase N